ncbi:hypothetical protein HX900_06320 [Rhizobium sp. WYCCWR 11290]|uniref:Uncharacterized protein n=1 Tax=Rhizobium changzhiense TaxID=2692317 RepID=A0A7Z0RIL0_9HYPH|nr:hypothetical protein [Rhizobium changzhiense]NZD60730.1 hypothetical protein [Rhizobium changzhiense]
MGYDLYITRKTNWFDAPPSIALDDWLEYVANDSEIQHDGFAETPTVDGGVLRVEQAGICVWTGYSRGENRENAAWLWWSGGNIVVKNPDQEICRKMWLIAQSLDAKVQGEEGEYYGRDGEIIVTPTNVILASERSVSPDPKRPWWKFW